MRGLESILERKMIVLESTLFKRRGLKGALKRKKKGLKAYYLEDEDSKAYSKGKEIWLKDALSRR
jgi:hypothetical protein